MIRRDAIRRFLVVALLAVCAVLLVFVLFYEKISPTTDVIDDVVMEADVELKTFNYTETVDGVAQWSLTGESAAHDFNQDQTQINQVKMELYHQKDLGTVVLTARQGTALLAQQQITVKGDVKITAENGYSLMTQEATYYGNHSDGGVIASDKPVTIHSSQLDLKGTGLLLDVGTRRMQMEHDVSAVFYPQAR